jgi:hypothetical protein
MYCHYHFVGIFSEFEQAMSGGGSSKGKGVEGCKCKAGKKVASIVWEGSLGPDEFEEPNPEFPLESKSFYAREGVHLRPYDNRREDWPKCRHGDDCVVQMYDGFQSGGRRFYRCPRGWVLYY